MRLLMKTMTAIHACSCFPSMDAAEEIVAVSVTDMGYSDFFRVFVQSATPALDPEPSLSPRGPRKPRSNAIVYYAVSCCTILYIDCGRLY